MRCHRVRKDSVVGEEVVDRLDVADTAQIVLSFTRNYRRLCGGLKRTLQVFRNKPIARNCAEQIPALEVELPVRYQKSEIELVRT